MVQTVQTVQTACRYQEAKDREWRERERAEAQMRAAQLSGMQEARQQQQALKVRTRPLIWAASWPRHMMAVPHTHSQVAPAAKLRGPARNEGAALSAHALLQSAGSQTAVHTQPG
jgi:hypothetical protein